MRKLALVFAVCGACRSSSGTSSQVIVDAFGGAMPEPGAMIVAHKPSGELVDVTTADASGRAEIGIDTDSLVSVVFPGTITSLTPRISIVTTVPPTDGSELEIHGPKSSGAPPLIVGALQLDGPNLNVADYFNVTLGCATVRVTSLPATIDVGACSMGTDQNLDVLVRGYHDISGTPHLDGYGAGRVAMVNNSATLRVSSWQSTGAAVPVTLDGIQPFINWTMHVDGMSFVDEPVGSVYTGLMVDSTTLTATVPAAHGARITTREVSGIPASIAFAATDFLDAIEAVPNASSLDPMTIQFDRADVGADAVNVHASWDVDASVAAAVPPGPHHVIWDAVLPTDVSSVTLPAIGDQLPLGVVPMKVVPSDVMLRHIDSPDFDGFAALRAAGIHAEATVGVSPIGAPTTGQVRVAQTIGGS